MTSDTLLSRRRASADEIGEIIREGDRCAFHTCILASLVNAYDFTTPGQLISGFHREVEP